MTPVGRIGRLVKSADKHPAPAVLIIWVCVFAALRIWSRLDDAPVLLARADPVRRAAIFGQITSTSVALLAVCLTVLAILYALPDRPTVQEMRESDTWPALQGLLLSVALLCLVAVVTAHVGTAVDHHKPGLEWLEQLMLSSAVVGVLALLVAGAVFAVILYVSTGPPDPSKNRGSLGGTAD